MRHQNQSNRKAGTPQTSPREPNPNIAQLERQAQICRDTQSPLTGAMLDAAAQQLDDTTATGRQILGWHGSAVADALPLRLTGGLHALARRGGSAALSSLYETGIGDHHAAFAEALRGHDAWICDWLTSPPQTNEVMRSGALMAGLMEATARLAQPIELLELGTSAGLNLNLDRFDHTLGGRRAGTAGSPVSIVPDWTGAHPADAPPRITARSGVDQAVIDVRDDAAAQRLRAYVWADQKDRLARIDAAIAIARAHPPETTTADAGVWIEENLQQEQTDGTLRVVMHSVFWQYLADDTKMRIRTAIRLAGVKATPARPLGRLTFEPIDLTGTMALRLRLWPSGDDLHLANCQSHGRWINWLL